MGTCANGPFLEPLGRPRLCDTLGVKHGAASLSVAGGSAGADLGAAFAFGAARRPLPFVLFPVCRLGTGTSTSSVVSISSRSDWCGADIHQEKNGIIKSVWVEKDEKQARNEILCGRLKGKSSMMVQLGYVCFIVCPVAIVQLNCHQFEHSTHLLTYFNSHLKKSLQHTMDSPPNSLQNLSLSQVTPNMENGVCFFLAVVLRLQYISSSSTTSCIFLD